MVFYSLRKVGLVLLVLFTACSPSSHKDFVQEADGVCKKLIQDLKEIERSQDLARMEKRLARDFDLLINVIIDARKHQLENPEDFMQDIIECDHAESFKNELRRVYNLEGGREFIEKVEREPVARLDRFEKSLKKKRNSLS